ncbi:SagB/ThcOx family dehydrogenase [Psychromonas hadalis]|uniref:SagB/ThcOx family dehydrogenase n=1 Tax=Psychromonas hadalis TaxID=211669 RepID=UPI0003B4C71F|nr:SagB/ThcOx family dehydrogenase [Psychromonas hadalis]
MTDPVLATILDYHQQSKHQPTRYARALGYMDWANQPIPYRLYQGAEKIPLPLIAPETVSPYSALSQKTSTPTQPISLTSIASMLQLSLGLSAWKQYGDSEWALRINPSSGNLHPTECYLLLPDLTDQKAASMHYNPYINSLEKLTVLPDNANQYFNKQQGFAIILTSIPWREAWKYGERAYRYCQHDLGHALAALHIACNINGWKMQLMTELDPQTAQKLLGLTQQNNDAEKEWAECVCWVSCETNELTEISNHLLSLAELAHPHQANQLSKTHADWPIIDNLFDTLHVLPLPNADAKKQPLTAADEQSINCTRDAQSIIQQRRSAQSFDADNSQITRPIFLQQLQKTLASHAVPFDVLPYAPQVHLAIFVHNVVGLTPGLYLWCRNDVHLPLLKVQMSDKFSWTQPINNQPLYLLEAGNFKARAKIMSCGQDIASDGAYSLGMLAQFSPVLAENPSAYPLLFWETGLIGQVLYLQAEAFSLRGTGIGCFFDDEMHKLLGLTNNNWQILYHFTVGNAIEDKRITTKPAYFHLQR